jgi:uncharacterized protein YecE (DUF72 family)
MCARASQRCGQCYNQGYYGGYSSAAERLTVAQDVVGSIPTSRPSPLSRSASQVPATVSERTAQNPGSGVYVGCSGWAYPTWKPTFYPDKLPSKKFLEYYATRLNSVEVNYTFRSFPRRTAIDSWLAQTGPGFRFSFKAPQRITHFQRLQDCGPTLEAFAGAIQPVADAARLGPVLFQLPPNFKADEGRLAQFLADAKPCRFRMAFEFRHGSWFDPAIYRILERHEAALCVAESDDLETPDVATAPFACYRRRKTEYNEAQLAQIASNLKRHAERGDVFAYFKHEEEPMGAMWAVSVLSSVRGVAS